MTANPHLLINRSTGGGVVAVSRSYIQAALRRADITAQDLRADRLLGEAQASGGDPLRLTHLFASATPSPSATAPRWDRSARQAQGPDEPAAGNVRLADVTW